MKPHVPTILDRWLTAMRTPGLYQQVTGRYCSESGFCGLGVLGRETGAITDLVRTVYACSSGIEFLRAVRTVDTDVKLTLFRAMKEVGLTSAHGEYLHKHVPHWNDEERLTLPQIANRVETLVTLWKDSPEEPQFVADELRLRGWPILKELAHVD